MMNFLTQPQVPLDPRLNAAPMVSETPTFTVGDYAKKKKLAEALRGRVGKGIQQYDPLITTAGNDYFPGQVQVNYAGILGNALNPWLESKQEGKAAAAEEDAQAAQDEALSGVDWSSIDPEKALQLSRMGIDPSVMAKFADTDKLGQYGNLVSSVPGVRLLMLKGKISPEQGEQMIRDIEAGKEPELTFEQRLQLKQAGRSITGGTTVINGADEGAFDKEWSKGLATDVKTAREAYQLAGRGVAAGQLYQDWAANPDNFTVSQQLVKLGSAAGLQPADAFLTPETRTAMSAAAEDVRNSLKALGGSDSNTDLIWATKALPTGAFTMDQAQAMSKYYAAQAQLTQAALQAQLDYYSVPENRTANKVPPDFYGMAKKSEQGKALEAAKASVEAANRMAPSKKTPANAGSAPP